MDVELSLDFKNPVSHLRLDHSSYRGGNVPSTRRHVVRPKKQTMPMMVSLPKEVEVDADPVSPGNDSPTGDMHSHLWGSVKSEPKQTVSMHLDDAEEMRVICKDESHLLGRAPDGSPDSIDSLSDSIQKKIELLEQPNDNYQVPSGWSTDHSIGTAQKDAMKSPAVDKPGGEDTDYCQSDSMSQEADSIGTVSEMSVKIHKKIKNLEEPGNFRAPPGWESRDSMGPVPSAKRGQPVQESGVGASGNVMASESYSNNQLHNVNTSYSYAVGPSDMEVELRPEDYSDMPLRLRVPNADIFLITSDDDKFCGKHLKDLMEEVEFKLTEDENTMCRVYLWDDMDHKSSIIDCITEAQEMCTYVFILLTKNFCKDRFAGYQKDDTLVRSVTTETRRWGIVPLYTQPKRDAPEDKAYKIPNGLISFKGLDMSRLMKDKKNVEELESLLDGDVYFRRGLVSMLEARIHERIEREAIRLKDRHVWIEQKKIQRRREILMEQNRTRLEMDRENRSIQHRLASLPKQLPLSPSSPVDFTQEEPKSIPCQRVKQATMQRSASCGGPSPPHMPGPGQPMFYLPYGQMMFSPEQHQMMQHQMYMSMLYMQPNMHIHGQQQPPMQPPLQPQFTPQFAQPQYPYANQYHQLYPQSTMAPPQPAQPMMAPPQPPQPMMAPPQPPQPMMAPPQPQQPVDPSGQGTPVHNYYIHAGGNVQVGSQATIVTHEPSATAGYEDGAEALEDKYNPVELIEEASKCTESPDVRTDRHRDWYAEPKKPPDEKPQEGHQHLRPPKASDMWPVIGRRSPVENQSPQLPDKLPAVNLDPDNPSSSSSYGKYYSSCPQTSQHRQAQEGSSEFNTQARSYSNRRPTPSEHPDTVVNSIPLREPQDLNYLGVEVRHIDPPEASTEDRYDSYEHQTLLKVIGDPSIPKPMSSYEPTGPQTSEDWAKEI